MRDLQNLKQFWHAHRTEPLALGTLIRKTGSSYRAVGAKKIIRQSDGACGLLSGGCLEQAIERTARARWDEMPFCESFSTLSDEDRVFGYQSGCAGIIDILFERLPADDSASELYLPFGVPVRAEGVRVSFEKSNGTSRHFVMTESHDAINVFFDKWRRPITLSVIGCGPDSLVFTEFARPLGWTAMFYDYRQAYAAAVPQAQCLPTKDIARAVKDGDECAVVLMTHNYQADMEILAGLVNRTFAYVGCLGPRERYERLKQDLKMHYRLTLTPEFEKKLYAPAGLLAKGRSPEDIALTIIAQIQMVMSDEGNDDR